MTLESAILILGNGLSLSIATGLIFVMLIQPRRNALNWWLTLFLSALALWAYFSMARVTPDMSPLSETHNFYLLFTGLTLTPITMYMFVVVLCKPRDRLAVGLGVWAALLIAGMLVLLWTDNVVAYHESGAAKYTFDLRPAGYVVLAHVVAYSLLSYGYLRFSDNPEATPLQLPVLLLMAGYASNLFVPLRTIPFDIGLTTIAAILIGYAVLRWQLFTPLGQANEQLRIANADLRLAINDLAAEKDRTETLNDELREASRYKSEFLTNMSHELRTPLNSIVGYSELLLKGIYGDISEKQLDRIGKIHRNGLNLLALINDILDLSRIEGGRLELNLSTVRLAALADSLLATVEPLAESKHLVLHCDLNAPLRLIRGDELRIRQVLLNLLGNAVKFTPAGHVRLAAHNTTVKDGKSEDFPLPFTGWLEDRHWVIVSVQDSGIGIPPEEQASIFEEFRQADSTVTRQYEGAGLGLAIAKRLVELHSGRIWVESKSGEGSIFYVALPALDEFDLPPGTAATPAANGSRTVLIIEDNDEAATILTDMLAAQNYIVVRAHDGPTGLARVHEVQPVAILVDILMPSLQGWNIVQRIKADTNTNHIPIMIVSVLDQRPTGIMLGTSACVSKPIQRDALLTALAHVQQGQIDRPVLVVDDNAKDRDTLCSFLKSEGIDAALCEDAQAALDWITQPGNTPGLVLLDLLMPHVSGFEVLLTLRSTPRLAEVPVVLLCPDQVTEVDHIALTNHIAREIQGHLQTPNSLIATLEAALS